MENLLRHRRLIVNRAAGVVFAYEGAALLSGGRMPTLTAICTRYRWLMPATVTGLLVHFWQYAYAAGVVAGVEASSDMGDAPGGLL